MSGRWRVGRRGSEWRGRPWLVLRGGEWEAAQWNGPVLTLERVRWRAWVPTSSRLRPIRPPRRAAARSRPGALVGEALLDQRLVAGIGNMWLAEALWHARLAVAAPR